MNEKMASYHANPVVVEAYAVPYTAAPLQSIPSAPAIDTSSSPGIPHIPSFHAANTFNVEAAKQFLAEHHWPLGLQESFANNLKKVAVRYFICDDSGSMAANDGHRLIPMDRIFRQISCSRWNELTSTLLFHAGVSRAANAPSEFRLLNGAPPIVIGDGLDPDNTKFETLKAVFENSPSGGTPLCRHIAEVVASIRAITPTLRANGQKAAVIIATDGESSDGDIALALRPLKELPAWVVIRLCTDEERIVNYWNSIDEELELDMDVLDDLCGEAREVTEKNPWLTYGDAMHKMREFGIPVKEIDLLDETALTLNQIRIFCAIIFGGTAESFPHPEIDWNNFKLALQSALSRTPLTWCPIRKTMRPWISVSAVSRLRPCAGGCSIC
jgi:hypothetical protein